MLESSLFSFLNITSAPGGTRTHTVGILSPLPTANWATRANMKRDEHNALATIRYSSVCPSLIIYVVFFAKKYKSLYFQWRQSRASTPNVWYQPLTVLPPQWNQTPALPPLDLFTLCALWRIAPPLSLPPGVRRTSLTVREVLPILLGEVLLV